MKTHNIYSVTTIIQTSTTLAWKIFVVKKFSGVNEKHKNLLNEYIWNKELVHE